MKRLLISVLVLVFVSTPFYFINAVGNSYIPIKDFSPKEGKVGTEVTITGESFISFDSVYFGNEPSIPSERDSSVIKVKVPVDAKTDYIYIGEFRSKEEFKVIENSKNTTSEGGDATSGATIKDNGGTIDNTEFSGLVPKCGIVENGVIKNPCNFEYFMKLLNKLINFVLFVIATPLAAVIIAYAGFLYLSEGSNSGNLNKAKTILKNVVYGYIIALIAWLLVKLIMETLGYSGISFLA